MAAFQFKLEAVLKQRQMIEDECQRELAKLLRQQLILETQVRTMQQSISTDKRDMAQALTGRVDVTRIRQHAGHATHMTAQAQQVVVRLLALHRQIEEARAKLLEAVKSRKAVELLRERQHRRWSQEQRRRENAELDEVGMQTFFRPSEAVA